MQTDHNDDRREGGGQLRLGVDQEAVGTFFAELSSKELALHKAQSVQIFALRRPVPLRFLIKRTKCVHIHAL